MSISAVLGFAQISHSTRQHWTNGLARLSQLALTFRPFGSFLSFGCSDCLQSSNFLGASLDPFWLSHHFIRPHFNSTTLSRFYANLRNLSKSLAFPRILANLSKSLEIFRISREIGNFHANSRNFSQHFDLQWMFPSFSSVDMSSFPAQMLFLQVEVGQSQPFSRNFSKFGEVGSNLLSSLPLGRSRVLWLLAFGAFELLASATQAKPKPFSNF